MRNAMMVVRCKYCNIKCRPINENGSNMWQCDYHGAVVVRYLYVAPDKFTTCFIVPHKSDKYYMWFLPFSDEYKFSINKYERYLSNKSIVSLEFIPDITPENAINKLITYIMFS